MDVEENIWMRHLEMSASKPMLDKIDDELGAWCMMKKATTFETYLESLETSKRLALEKIRKTVHTAAPGAEECICYGIPSFRLNGKMLVAIGATAKHCAFYPMSGGTVEAFAEKLSGFDTSKGTIRFQPENPLPATLVRQIVKARMAENAGNGT